MRKLLVMILLLIFLSACSNNNLNLPTIDENRALVTHVKEPILAVMDIGAQEIIHSVTLDFTIHSLTKVGINKVAFSGKLESEVLLLDITNGEISTLLTDTPGITDLFYDEQKENLLLTEAKNNQVIVFDLNENKKIAQISVENYPNSITVLNDFAYVVSGDDETVSVIDLTKNKVISTFKTIERPTTIYEVGTYLLVGGHGAYGDLNEYVYVYEPMTGKQIDKIKVGLMPIAFYADQYSEEIAVLCHGSNELYILDKTTLEVKTIQEASGNPYYVTANEEYLFVTALDGDQLMVYDRKNMYEKVQQLETYNGPFGIVLGGESDDQ